jgi:hypothetical protein
MSACQWWRANIVCSAQAVALGPERDFGGGIVQGKNAVVPLHEVSGASLSGFRHLV